MGVDQASRPLSWDVAMSGKLPNLEDEKPPLKVQVGDRSATYITDQDSWADAMSLANALSLDTELRCIVTRCARCPHWAIWLTNQAVDITRYLNA